LLYLTVNEFNKAPRSSSLRVTHYSNPDQAAQ